MEQQIKIIREALELIEAIVKQPVNSGSEELIKEIDAEILEMSKETEDGCFDDLIVLLNKCKTALSQVKPSVVWECFMDRGYYDLWAVRPVDDNDLSSLMLFHLPSQGEAERLMDLLNNQG